jgi:hypothetical protein
MLENLTKESLTENIATRFKASLEGTDSVELELVSVDELASAPGQEQLSVIFRGPLNIALPQTTYNIEHEQLGNFGLFLVPVGIEKEGRVYEAFFNRFIK